MVRRQTNGWLLTVKWLLIPATLAAVGYFFMGPIVPKVMPGRAPITTPDATTAGDPTKKAFTEPSVEVSVKPASNSYRSSSDRPRRKKRKRRTTTPPANTAPVEAPVQSDPPVEAPPDTTGGG